MRPSRIYHLSPRIYSPPPFQQHIIMRPSQNIPLPLRIYPPFQQMYMCDPPRIFPSLPEYTPLFNNYMRPSRNLPLPEYTPFCNNYTIMRPSQNPPLPPRIYPPFNNYMRPSRIYPPSQNIPPFFNKFICATLPESTPPTQNIPPFLTPLCDLPESTPPSQNIPPFSTIT